MPKPLQITNPSLIAVCEDCEWKSENFTKGRELAQRHAMKTGHLVKVETGVEYDGRKEQ